MPRAYNLRNSAPPADLCIPENLVYDYMIYRLSKIFSIGPYEAGKMNEKDFWLYIGFENIEHKRKEYQLEKNK
jgi:hypothetical protein